MTLLFDKWERNGRDFFLPVFSFRYCPDCTVYKRRRGRGEKSPVLFRRSYGGGPSLGGRTRALKKKRKRKLMGENRSGRKGRRKGHD